MKRHGSISEQFYDSFEFPVDEDSQGNLWRLTAKSIVFARSMPLYSDLQLRRKREENLTILHDMQAAQQSQLRGAQTSLMDNRECERLLLKELGKPADSDVSSTLVGASIKTFEKPTTKLLAAFVKVRKFEDATATWRVPNKGKATTANELCSKTEGPLLIKMAFDMRAVAPKATVPNLPPVEIPRTILPQPSVIEFSTTEQLEVFAASEEYCHSVYNCVKSINHLGADVLESHMADNVATHNKIADLLAAKLLARLPFFVEHRVPSAKRHLLPGRHWVWSSFASKLRRICTVLVLANVVADELELRSPSESLLASPNLFQHAVGDLSNLDGCYAVEDSRRNEIIRGGMTERGFQWRWKQHMTDAKLGNPKTKGSVFYNRYPDESIAHQVPLRKGTFQGLKQLVAVGFDRSKASEVVACFEWHESELNALKKLKMPNGRNTLIHRQYKHVCYLLETAVALAIQPSKNLSSNPTCEWQLGFHGSDETQ